MVVLEELLRGVVFARYSNRLAFSKFDLLPLNQSLYSLLTLNTRYTIPPLLQKVALTSLVREITTTSVCLETYWQNNNNNNMEKMKFAISIRY